MLDAIEAPPSPPPSPPLGVEPVGSLTSQSNPNKPLFVINSFEFWYKEYINLPAIESFKAG